MARFTQDTANEARATPFRFAFAVLAAFLLAACSKEDIKPDMRLVEAFVEVRIIEQNYGAEAPAARLARQAVGYHKCGICLFGNIEIGDQCNF